MMALTGLTSQGVVSLHRRYHKTTAAKAAAKADPFLDCDSDSETSGTCAAAAAPDPGVIIVHK